MIIIIINMIMIKEYEGGESTDIELSDVNNLPAAQQRHQTHTILYGVHL